MENKPWDKAKLEEWKKFWESDMGKEAIDKMQRLKNQCFELSMQPTDPNAVAYYIGRAGGIDLVLQDIQAGITALEEFGKEDKQKK